jgi:hypothetical protein
VARRRSRPGFAHPLRVGWRRPNGHDWPA